MILILFVTLIIHIDTTPLKASNDLHCELVYEVTWSFYGIDFRFRRWTCTCTDALGREHTYSWFTIDYYGIPLWKSDFEPQPRISLADNVEDNNINSIIIYPNPANEFINIRNINNNKEEYKVDISLYNSNMKEVKQLYIGILKDSDYRIMVNQYPSGSYFIKINYDGNNILFKQLLIIR